MSCRRQHASVLLLMLWATSPFACDRSPAPGAGAPVQSPARVEPAPLEPPAGPFVAGTRLIDPGRRPRTALRYTPAIGSPQLITSRYDHGTGATVDGQRVAIEQAPNTVAIVSIEPLALIDEGIHVRCEQQGMWVGEEDTTGWEEWAAEFERVSRTAMEQTVATTYIPSGREFSDPTESDTERAHAQSVLHLSMLSPVVLPEEPVGIGAVWEMSETVEMAMVVTRVQRRYRLRSVDGNRIVVEMSQRHTGMPGPTSTSTHDYAELLSREAIVHGEAEMDLTLPGPVSGWFESDYATRIRAYKGEETSEVVSRTSFRHTWEPYQE